MRVKESSMTRNSKRRISLSLKINLLIVSIIILVTLGLVMISSFIFGRNITRHYTEQTVFAAQAGKEEIIPDMVRHFWNEINTDEFRNMRAKALAAQDETMIRDWMISRPCWMEDMDFDGLTIDVDPFSDLIYQDIRPEEEYLYQDTLYHDYQIVIHTLDECKILFTINDAYIQYDEDGVTYNLVDPGENLFYIGTIEETIDVFANFNMNSYFPPTVYRSVFGWLCTTLMPLDPTVDGEIPGYVGADADMNQVILQQQRFVKSSGLYVLGLTVVSILISMLVMHRTIVDPLKQLSVASAGFAKDDQLAAESVIDLPIRSNDEIGDLYQQIRSMQTRIIDYTNHLTQITAERERVSTELRMAESIQRAMLQENFPAFPNHAEFDLFGSMTPAREVGGDFYDFLMPDDEHLAVVIADVSDKGVVAALFMMASKILINYRIRQGGTPAQILTDVNAQLSIDNNSKMFVTVWMGILDLKTGVMICANAGHEYPFIRGEDGTFRLFRDKHGLVVGAMPMSKYKDYELRLEPGDSIFVYTDGVLEANNENAELYGKQRLEAALNQVPDDEPQHILEHVKADVDAFVSEAKQFDDLTMLCVKYKYRLVR